MTVLPKKSSCGAIVTTAHGTRSQVKKKSLYKLDMYSYFDFISICDIKEFKSKLFKYYEDVWKLKTKSLPKLRTYVTFKSYM